MATRSTIGVLHSDRTITHVYCHSDGYPSWNGKRLQEHWASTKKANALIRGGAMSYLGYIVGKKHSFDWRRELERDFEAEFAAMSSAQKGQFLDRNGEPNRYVYEQEEIEKDPRSKYTLYYRRDRGDKERSLLPQTDTAWDDGIAEAYAYLWCEVREFWLIGIWGEHRIEWRRLTDVLALPEKDDANEGTMNDDAFSLANTPAIDLYAPNRDFEMLEAAQEALAFF